MDNFAQREKKIEKSRPITEIAADILGIDNSKIDALLDYTKNKKPVFHLEENDYGHIFYKEIVGIRANSHQISTKHHRSEQRSLELIGYINGLNYLPKTQDIKDDEKKDEYFGIVLFREQLEKGFTEGKVTEAERQEWHKKADDVQKNFDKLKLLGKELETAVNKQQADISINR